MLQKPHYCCNCGEKVNRAIWRWWNSRRFCELCETEFVFEEWWPRVAQLVVLSAVFVAFGSQTFEAERNKVPEIRREVIYRNSEPTPRSSESIKEKIEKGETSRRIESASVGKAGTAGSKDPRDRRRAFEEPAIVIEPKSEKDLVFCGVTTKKGTPCSRRVKEGTRCWQHKNKVETEKP